MSGHDSRHCHHGDHDAADAAPYGQVQFDPTVGRRALMFGASGALLLAAMRGSAQASTTTASTGWAGTAAGAGRTSALTLGTTLVHADMHNHSVMSDGDHAVRL